MERNLDNDGPHSATPTDTDFKGKQSKRAPIHIISRYKRNGILRKKKKDSKAHNRCIVKDLCYSALINSRARNEFHICNRT